MVVINDDRVDHFLSHYGVYFPDQEMKTSNYILNVWNNGPAKLKDNFIFTLNLIGAQSDYELPAGPAIIKNKTLFFITAVLSPQDDNDKDLTECFKIMIANLNASRMVGIIKNTISELGMFAVSNVQYEISNRFKILLSVLKNIPSDSPQNITKKDCITYNLSSHVHIGENYLENYICQNINASK
ncbi:MAG: hypothetical protein HQK51_19135, partial [Oligoflexia bacterium]|nr:hypothetical protein [Oligoflexia bacterium]